MNFYPLTNPQPFYEQIWKMVRLIPVGRVATYSQIAQLIDRPEEVDDEQYHVFGSRWVGNGMAACPPDVPWQRVINAQGKISRRPGAEQQRRLLENEGVLFKKDKIDLKMYQWRGPNHPEEPRQARLL